MANNKCVGKLGTFLHLLKANMGPGLLAVPHAMSNFGLLAGAIGAVFLGSICVYCMHILVSCSKIVSSRMLKEEKKQALMNISAKYSPGYTKIHDHGLSTDPQSKLTQELELKYSITSYHDTKPLDYATTAEKAFYFGPWKWRNFASPLKFAVNLLLALTQLGFCCVYFIFVAQSLQEIFVHLKILPFLSVEDIMLLELPFLIVLNLIPNLSNLTFVTTTALALQATGLSIMFYYFLSGEKNSESVVLFLAPYTKWPLFFGTIMYSFEGIGVVLPLENDMEKKEDFRGWNGILNVGMCIVILFNVSLGVCGYMKYGSSIEPSVTFNLSVGWLSEVIRLMFALSVCLTYPLQMYVPFSFALPYLKKKLIRETFKTWVKCVIECMIRASFVTFTFVLARSIPRLDLVISLIGAFASSGLALILPPIIHILAIWETDIYQKKWMLALDVFICLFGFFGLLVGSGTAIWEIWKTFHPSQMNLTQSTISTNYTLLSFNELYN